MNNDKEYDGLFDEDIDVVSNNDTKDDLNTEDISSDNVDNAEDNQDKQYKEDKLKRKEREDKLLKVFGTEMTVHKNLKKTSFFKSYNIPSFLRDWLLEKFRDGDDFDSDGIKEYIKSHIPNKEGFFVIKDKIMKSAELAKILTRVGVDLDVLTNKNRFSMPEYGISENETNINEHVWNNIKDSFISGKEVWGMATLGYRQPDENAKPKIKGAITLEDFKLFNKYSVDLEDFKEYRKEFTINEWIDVIISAIDYNPEGYENDINKLTVIKRLLTFVEKRLNIVELAPKGTGKSYLFGSLSKYGYLNSGGTLSRTKMFYDRSKKRDGYIINSDFVALDEIQYTGFTNVDEMRQALQGYMEQGQVGIDGHTIIADAGVIILGNIDQSVWDINKNMFIQLPEAFKSSALLDRFHGFIEGWLIPRMHEDLKVEGVALNSEYFTCIMHEMRSDANYRKIVDELIVVPTNADTRDTESVKRVATAFLKLLFPNSTDSKYVNREIFNKYCLEPAIRMRGIINKQNGFIDTEFKDKIMANYSLCEYDDEIKEKYEKDNFKFKDKEGLSFYESGELINEKTN